MAAEELHLEAAERRIEVLTLGFGGAAALAAALGWGWREAGAAAAGAALTWLNYRWLRQAVASLARAAAREPKPDPARFRRASYAGFLARYALLIVAAYVILARFHWPAVAFLSGLLAVVPAALIVAVQLLAAA
jgi:ATP synthase I chain